MRFVAVRSNPELFRTRRDGFVPQSFYDVPAPRGSQLADPFVVEDNGRNWLFVEEVPATVPKGHLSVIELGRNGDFNCARSRYLKSRITSPTPASSATRGREFFHASGDCREPYHRALPRH